jgi:hypothetical protein
MLLRIRVEEVLSLRLLWSLCLGLGRPGLVWLDRLSFVSDHLIRNLLELLILRRYVDASSRYEGLYLETRGPLLLRHLMHIVSVRSLVAHII